LLPPGTGPTGIPGLPGLPPPALPLVRGANVGAYGSGVCAGNVASDMPPEVVEQLEQLREDHSKMKKAASEASKNGDAEGSEFKAMLAGEIQEKIRELEAKYPKKHLPPVPKTAGLVATSQQQLVPAAPLPPAAGSFKDMPMMLPPPPGLMLPPGGPGSQPPRLPGMLPPPRLPGMPQPGVNFQDWQRMMMMTYNPDLAVNITQQQALEYDQEKANCMNMEPEVIELAHHFNLTDRHARMLDEQLKRRNNTYEDDIASMYEILKGAKNPADLLMVSIRWMAEGVFRGTQTPNPDVEKVAKKYKLDAPSACKLAEVLESRNDPDNDLRKICTHLERSNRPSALVMMMLKDLKSGNPIDESSKAPAIGSYLHKIELERSSRRSKSRGRGGGRSRSRRRARSSSRRGGGAGRGGRSRSRERRRGRSRS